MQTSEQLRDVRAARNTQYDLPAEYNCAGKEEEKSGKEQGLLLQAIPLNTLLTASLCQKKK